jgi:hypothetical protein
MKRQAAEVVAVEVAQHDRVDVVEFDAEILRRDECRGAAVHEELGANPGEMHARLEPASVVKSIS